LLDKLING